MTKAILLASALLLILAAGFMNSHCLDWRGPIALGLASGGGATFIWAVSASPAGAE